LAALYYLIIMDKVIPDMKTTRITDGKILLRPLTIKDAPGLHRAVRESLAELQVWMPWAHPDYNLKETKKWLKSQSWSWKKGAAYNFAITHAVTGEILGACGIDIVSMLNRIYNLGYWVRSDRTGQGIAPSAAILLAKWSFEAVKPNRIEIHVAVENSRSLRVAEKVGAVKEGIMRNGISLHGKTHNEVMHSLIPGDL
jgi:RimJ/RimL family protein N-acetyltransferase